MDIKPNMTIITTPAREGFTVKFTEREGALMRSLMGQTGPETAWESIRAAVTTPITDATREEVRDLIFGLYKGLHNEKWIS